MQGCDISGKPVKRTDPIYPALKHTEATTMKLGDCTKPYVDKMGRWSHMTYQLRPVYVIDP